MTHGHEVRWRLRNEGRVVGYQRSGGGTLFFSTDGLWWHGSAMAFDAKDRCSPAKDRRTGLWVYERDVVQTDGHDGSWVVCWDGNGWVLRWVDDPRVSLPWPETPLRVVGNAALGLLGRLR